MFGCTVRRPECVPASVLVPAFVLQACRAATGSAIDELAALDISIRTLLIVGARERALAQTHYRRSKNAPLARPVVVLYVLQGVVCRLYRTTFSLVDSGTASDTSHM